ncbi:MAG: HEAT repeat domain-containing protein [Gemmataceae bacterium]|nr:HEAT repeat domain-containing protein [Gemmataceae bacterium]
MRPCVLLALLSLVFVLEAAPPPVAANVDEQMLEAHGVSTTDAALLEFFRARTATTASRQEIARLIAQLDSNQFPARQEATRKLIEHGPPALSALRAATVANSLEVTRRAEHCIAAIERSMVFSIPLAAARLLAARKPDGATEVLLAYLPCADDALAEEQIISALAEVGVRDGKPHEALVKAATDTLPLHRVTAATALARAVAPEYRAAVHKLLVDSSPRVRLTAARSLLLVNDKAAVAALLDVLVDAPASEARQADNLLCMIAGKRVAPLDLSSPDVLGVRRKSRDAWAEWWKAKEVGVDLGRLKLDEALDPSLTKLVDRCTDVVRNHVFGNVIDGKSKYRAQIAAIMIAVHAQSGPQGAASFRRATLRNAALKLLSHLKANERREAQRIVQSLPYLHPDMGAALGTVTLLDRYADVEELMHQFRNTRGGGMGTEMQLEKLAAVAQRQKALAPADLHDELELSGLHLAHVADAIRDYKPGNKLAKDWPKHVDEAQQAGLALATAVRARDGKAAAAAVIRVDRACQSCHEKFRY